MSTVVPVTLGERFARALAAKDWSGVAAMLHNDEQTADYDAVDGRITTLRSGFIPATGRGAV